MSTELNKAIVRRFNKEIIEQGTMDSFKELVADNVINHSALAGFPNGPESMIFFISNVLRRGLSNIQVDILDQVAEGDKVTTRKIISGTHTGEFMGVPPSNKKIVINVIDIIRLKDGKYAEHWGLSNLSDVLKTLEG